MCEECEKYKREIEKLENVLRKIMDVKSCNYPSDRTANVCNLPIIREIIEDVLDE